ncbi:MAG: hypothetical protein IJ680_02320 [Paludibacteraceae bacterium]|nr:hypothetical protein [Paludibacteraceae bacterium]
MTAVEIIAHFLGQMGLWMNDNLGDGDGTQYIREIWKQEPDMASHLASKWLGYLEQAKENTGIDTICQPPTNEFVGLTQANAPVRAQADQPQ